MGSPRWLERYREGRREQVWPELRQCGQRVREPDLAAEAQSVRDEMARRARHNLDVAVARLTAQGWPVGALTPWVTDVSWFLSAVAPPGQKGSPP